MRLERKIILILAFSLFLSNGSWGLAEEVVQSEQGVASSETETQWVWGEIISVDTQNRAILLKFLDYDTDTEKEISINVDDKTTYENVTSIDQIKPRDAVSVDYIVAADGKNVAENISVEKPEELPATEEATQEILEQDSGLQE